MEGSPITDKNLRYIKVEEPKILKKRCLISRITVSKNIDQFFRSKNYFFCYDIDIVDVPTSILQIPIVSNLITIAWAVGADLYVKEFDNEYLTSLNEVKNLFERWYPNLSYSTKIFFDKLVTNKYPNGESGLLFSEGLDCIASLISNKEKKPHLIFIWGIDIPLEEKQFWVKVWNDSKKYAENEGVELHYVKTNLRRVMNEIRLNAIFGKYLYADWWTSIQHGLSFVGLCAPYTKAKGIGTLFYATDHSPTCKYITGSHIFYQNNFCWGNTKVIYDGLKSSRQEKIQQLKEYIQDPNKSLKIRVCSGQYQEFNCSKCEKCRRTILGLVLENIDPNSCGFHVTDSFFSSFKDYLLSSHDKFIVNDSVGCFWRDIQKSTPEKIDYNLYNSREFFQWFRSFNLKTKVRRRTPNFVWDLGSLYIRLPQKIRVVTDKFKSKFENWLRSIIIRI